MPAINNLNVQVDQNLNNLNNQGIHVAQPQGTQQTQELSPSQLLSLIKTGTIVEGRVLSQNSDGTYTVKLDNSNLQNIPELKANATLPLIVGERFRAVWDLSGSGSEKIPVLRLSQGELSFLSQVPAKDRELATALLSRGLPLSNEIMTEIRDAWRKTGLTGLDENNNLSLSSMIELWARRVPMTAENAALLSEYMALDAETATFLWDKIRKEIKERASQGQDPISALKNMKSGNDDTARFLNAHSILMRSPRDDINPALLSAPFWPVTDDAEMTARVFVGRSIKDDNEDDEERIGKRYWQIGFNLKGYELGNVGGLIESDGRGCNVNLQAENENTCDVLTSHRREIRRELDGTDLPVRFIGISHRAVASETIRADLMRARGLDVKV